MRSNNAIGRISRDCPVSPDHAVRRTPHPRRPSAQHTRLDHVCGDVQMPQQILERPDVVPVLQRCDANECRRVWHVAGL